MNYLFKNVEVNPCPFCGSKDITFGFYYWGHAQSVYIMCVSCKAKGKRISSNIGEKDSIELWNKNSGLYKEEIKILPLREAFKFWNNGNRLFSSIITKKSDNQPCPFCGSNNINFGRYSSNKSYVTVYCSTCKSEGSFMLLNKKQDVSLGQLKRIWQKDEFTVEEDKILAPHRKALDIWNNAKKRN